LRGISGLRQDTRDDQPLQFEKLSLRALRARKFNFSTHFSNSFLGLGRPTQFLGFSLSAWGAEKHQVGYYLNSVKIIVNSQYIMKLHPAKFALLLLPLALFTTACGGGTQVGELKDKATQVQETAQKAQNVLEKIGPFKENLLTMKDGATQTLSAVKSGDFATAQTQFGKLQQSWTTIEGDIKTISGDSHKSIQTNIDTIATDLKAPTPDAAKITTDLQALSGNLGNLATGGGGGDAMADSGSSPAAPATTADSGTKPEATTTADSGQSIQSNLIAMKDSLKEAKTAVEASDFSTAKTAFSDARQSWFKFGGSIKQSSPDTYASIDEGVKTVNSGLNAATPTQDTLLSSLQTLSTSLDSVAPN
jgi:hypothetical protein